MTWKNAYNDDQKINAVKILDILLSNYKEEKNEGERGG